MWKVALGGTESGGGGSGTGKLDSASRFTSDRKSTHKSNMGTSSESSKGKLPLKFSASEKDEVF